MTKENIIKRIGHYLEEIKGELKKVTWPTKEDMQKTTVAVLVISVIFGVYLQVVDYSFHTLIMKVIGLFR